MTANNVLEELSATLIGSLGASMSPEGYALLSQLIRLLAEGKPVSPERIASALGRSREEVMGILSQRPDIEWDDAGSIVGAGLTLRPTRHRFQTSGRLLYTWCALDALMFPGIIGETVRVESPCAGTGQPVRVTVTPEGMESVEPSGAVVSFVAPEASLDIRRVFCCHVNFFSSPSAASEWLASHPGATTLPVDEAYQLGRRLAQSVFQARSPA